MDISTLTCTGNLRVGAAGEVRPTGIMGYIDEYTRRVYAEILFGFIRRDYHRVAQVHFEAATFQLHRTSKNLRVHCALLVNLFLGWMPQISWTPKSPFEVTERFGMETRTELILLQRTMVVVGALHVADPALISGRWQNPL